jgi:hypothetical protein
MIVDSYSLKPMRKSGIGVKIVSDAPKLNIHELPRTNMPLNAVAARVYGVVHDFQNDFLIVVCKAVI